ncbi:MAG: hypothetical protein ACYCY1_16715 [Sulfuriferula sp.]
MNRGLFPILVIFAMYLAILGGCSMKVYDPHFWHTNFVESLNVWVGQRFEKNGMAGWTTRKLLSTTKLPNGNVAYKYLGNGSCRWTFDVDPLTDIIRSVHWEGSELDCVIVP